MASNNKVSELQEQYAKILRTYVETYDETCLFQVSQLAKQFLEEKVGPDEVAEMHSRLLTTIVKGMTRDQTIEAFQHAVNPLLELMMGYAVAYQSYLDSHEKEFEEFKKRGHSVNFEQLASVGMLSLGMMGRVGALLEGAVNAQKVMAISGNNGHDRKQLMDDMIQQTGQALATTKTLGGYSRKILKNEIVEVDVAALVRESLEIVRRLVNFDGINVSVDLRDAPVLVTSPGELQELIVCLIANAVDTIKGSGELSIVSRYELSKPTNYHMVGIAYRAGTPKNPYIFSLPYGGSSMGLEIAKNVSQRRGAVLEIKSKGTATSMVLKISPVDELDGVVMKL